MKEVRLTVATLKDDIISGMKRPEIAEKYGVTTAQIKEAIEMAGLSDLRAGRKEKVKFVFTDLEEAVPAGSNHVTTEEGIQ